MTKLLGAVISAATNLGGALLVAIEERAHDLGYDLILAHSLNDPEREESAFAKSSPAAWMDFCHAGVSTRSHRHDS
jgi:DNA-binding LacI/PurR family transcriptional regulator